MKRGSGILLHITSLPSAYGIGDLGPAAYKFLDFLACANQKYWQVLPVTCTDPALDYSPYSANSAFAGNPLLISPELLVEEGLLSKKDLKGKKKFLHEYCDYVSVAEYKNKILEKAFENYQANKMELSKLEKFSQKYSYWLDDFALFSVIRKRYFKLAWNKWPEEIKNREKESLNKLREELAEEMLKEKFIQYVFCKQWLALRMYACSKDIKIIGDLPIYVGYNSADVWAHQEIFKLKENKEPEYIAGVPPDYFSKKGQLWKNPVYRWDILQKEKYQWWQQRLAHNQQLFDIIRIDHFRGFVAYWEVEAKEKTAINGRWVKTPAKDFFNYILKELPKINIIAEDLGIMTPEVQQVKDHFGFPGMKVLQFAFGNDDNKNPYLPHNYEKNCVVYTGTHDNNTIKGWFLKEAKLKEKQRLFKYLGRKVALQGLPQELIRLAMDSVADVVIIPLQDILGLGAKARMNIPGTTKGNWRWRVLEKQFSTGIIQKLAKMTKLYGRN
ncbi:MAG: 4-alpha-glucanotransferase [Candidatus Margulisbacteria bacterium]|nr:4-alpha-glucanotransferase [Candidatus Margulisiibacteriota bacterium]